MTDDWQVLHRCVWGWLYVTADAVASMRPGLGREVLRRRGRATLFSRLLLSERHELCGRCLFFSLFVTKHFLVRDFLCFFRILSSQEPRLPNCEAGAGREPTHSPHKAVEGRARGASIVDLEGG